MLLDYSKDKNLFSYPAYARKVVGCSTAYSPSGDVNVFGAEFPGGAASLQHFKSMYPDARATAAAAEAIANMRAVRESLESPKTAEEHSELFARHPYAHQSKAIEYMLKCDKLMLLLEQGLGKTFIAYMAVRLFKELGIPHKTVVVCPRIVLPNWLREVRQFTDMKILPYYGDPSDRENCRNAIQNSEWDMIVTTFDMLIRRKNISADSYMALWDTLSVGDRNKLVESFVSAGHITADDAMLLRMGGTTAKYRNSVAKILRSVPVKSLPAKKLASVLSKRDTLTFLEGTGYDNLIVDEASRCIDHSSKRSAAVLDMAGHAKRVYLMSGTLCVGRPTDMYMPANILDSCIFDMNWTQFRNKYCIVSSYNRHIIRGYKNVDDLKRRVDPYILEMKREDCLDMPDRIVVDRYYDVSLEQEELYNQIVFEETVNIGDRTIHTELAVQKINKMLQVLSGFVHADDNTDALCESCKCIYDCVVSGVTPHSEKCPKHDQVTTSYIELGNAKLDLLNSDLEDIDGKVIIWAWYRYDLERIRTFLREKEIGFVCAGEKDCDVRFNTDDSIRVFLGQTRQGIGITLNAARTTIYYSHGPDLEARLQSMDRNYRIGQSGSVVVHDYVCSGSIEENMLDLLRHKENVMRIMQAKSGCPYCAKFSECRGAGRLAHDVQCEHITKMELVSEKRTLGISALQQV